MLLMYVNIYSKKMKPDQTIQHYTLHGTSWPSAECPHR